MPWAVRRGRSASHTAPCAVYLWRGVLAVEAAPGDAWERFVCTLALTSTRGLELARATGAAPGFSDDARMVLSGGDLGVCDSTVVLRAAGGARAWVADAGSAKAARALRAAASRGVARGGAWRATPRRGRRRTASAPPHGEHALLLARCVEAGDDAAAGEAVGESAAAVAASAAAGVDAPGVDEFEFPSHVPEFPAVGAPTESARALAEEFTDLFTRFSVAQMRDMAASGCLRGSSLRSLFWRRCLGCLPRSAAPAEWPAVVTRQRAAYEAMRRAHVRRAPSLSAPRDRRPPGIGAAAAEDVEGDIDKARCPRRVRVCVNVCGTRW